MTLESFRTKSNSFSVPNLKTIETLHISSVSAIADLSFLADFTNLKKLSLFELQSKALFDFTKLKNLKVLNLTNMFHLKNLQELKTIQTLEDLTVHLFYINRKIKTDIKSELLKVIAKLQNIKSVKLIINNDSYDKNELIRLQK